MADKQLIYCSENNITSIKDIVAMAHRAGEFNKTKNITGSLFFSYKFFIQLLEGEKSEVDSLYGRIVKDTRHENIQLIYDQEVEQRFFPAWNMQEVTEKDIDFDSLSGFFPDSVFDPYSLSVDQALQFFRDCVAYKESA
tara:strand:+ start:997 stop:1413 length:417 start_codon:yes stop_codon:yes gene_type:complete